MNWYRDPLPRQTFFGDQSPLRTAAYMAAILAAWFVFVVIVPVIL